VEPENRAPFLQGERANIRLSWTSDYTLKPDECFLVTLRWTESGTPANNLACVQSPYWFVDRALYLRADQETERLYTWSVCVAQRIGAQEDARFVPLSASSEERSFYWK
jgi:hypothetical protein